MNSLPALLVLGAAVAFLMFTLTWVLSRKLDNYSFVDITWSYGLAILAPLYATLTTGYAPRHALALAMAMIWSLRLGTYLLLRIKAHHPHEDVRYQVLRKKWQSGPGSRFFLFFQAQALLIVLLSVPVLLAFLNPRPSLSAWEVAGFGVWLLGIAGEATADWQMQHFKSDPANRGRVCDIGLWRYSRHPNYFFESLVWWAFWIFACGSPWGWITLYAPLLILHFLLRVTGIPLTEKCAVESKGDAYREYQRTTSAFIPWFPKNKTS
jgi:steroid 5-alpha reductase family enzyme